MGANSPETSGPIYGEIGREVADIIGGNPDNAYLYAVAGDWWSGGSIFREEGDTIQYYQPSNALAALILEVWDAQEPGRRWTVMEYRIRGSSFDASFIYPEDLNPEWGLPEDGIEEALRRQFGDKPVIYPPPPSEEDASA